MRFGPVTLAVILSVSILLAVPFSPSGSSEEVGPSLLSDRILSREIPLDGSNWPMYRGDPTHIGSTSSAVPMENTTDLLWGQRVDNLIATASPVIMDGVVYIGSGDGRMRGYDIDTGEDIWEVYIGNHRIRGAASIDSGNIFFGADNGHLYGFRISDKTKFLDIDLDGSEIESSPLIIGDRAYVGVNGAFLRDNKFHAVDITNQTVNWTLSMGDLENFYGFKETAAYWNGWIYIGDGNGTFYCLDEDGQWDGNDGPFMAETNLTDTSPDIIWMRVGFYSISTDAMIAEGNVFYGNIAGKLFCVDAMTGVEQWNRTVGKGERSFQSCPSYDNGRVYTTARNSIGVFEGASVFCLDSSDGSQIWRFNISGQIITESSPVIVEGGLVFGSRNHKVYCISTQEENLADEDRILWTVSTGSPITSSPAVSNGRIFISNEPIGNFGKLFAIGAPDPSIERIWMSDPSPYVGEKVQLKADIFNKATVDCVFSVEFRTSTLNNSKQSDVGKVEGVLLEAESTVTVEVDWTVELGFDYFAAFIKDVTPEDMDTDNNFGSFDLFLKTPLTTQWTSSGSGPQMDGGAGERLESNRSFWNITFQGPWPGTTEPIWYDGFGGNGTISSTGAALYLTDPLGSLVALNATPETDGRPGTFWTYSNNSVDFAGRPAILVDQELTFGGPNRIFSYGDDGAIWAFDWVGFWDGFNDGPYQSESRTGTMDGDVIWRSELPSQPSRPLMVCGGNLIIECSDGSLRGMDDDTGEILWTRSLMYSNPPMAADLTTLFISEGGKIKALDPNDGSVIRTMGTSGFTRHSNISSISVTSRGLLVSNLNSTALFDLDPSDGIDEGVIDNSTDSDMIWELVFSVDLSSPAAVSPTTNIIGIVAGSRATFHYLKNGTEISNLSVQNKPTGRMVSGGDSFYVVTGSSPWMVRAYSPTEIGSMEPTWTMELGSKPRGELVIVGDHMYISLSNGKLISLGADNNPPEAIISSPLDGILLFPGEAFTLDASGSSDEDDDPLTYVWIIEGETTPIYEGSSPVFGSSLQGVGRKKLVLRVYDDMRAFGEDVINITLLKRISYPIFEDVLYDISINMSYGISEASGRGLVNVSIPADTPDPPGSVFTCHIEFVPWPVYAQYRFEWANVTIGFKDKEFEMRMNEERMGIFFYDPVDQEWERAPVSQLLVGEQKVYGNFSDLRTGYYALGILDNNVPELRHKEAKDYRYRMLDSTDYMFRLEYRDSDDDIPDSVKLVVDNKTEYNLVDEGFATSVTRWTFYSVSDVDLIPGAHIYYFEADDGNFIVRSDYFEILVGNSPPVAKIIGPTSVVKTGDIVLFDGSGSYDPDGDPLSFSWDFDSRDGIRRDEVDSKVDHIYYDKGNYIVTLTVSDGADADIKTLSITVIDNKDDTPEPPIPVEIWILIIAVMGFLILAIVVFIVISRRGHEEESDLQRKFEGRWSCPECGTRVPNGVEECPKCDYLYDPLDFDEEDHDDHSDELDEM